MDPLLTLLVIVAVGLYLFNQVHFISAPVRKWITSVAALMVVVWVTASLLRGWAHRLL